jgi:hypothetical protein
MEKELNYIEVSVLNWDRYQSNKKNGEYSSLLRFSLAANFFSDSKIVRLSSSSKLLFVYILAECAKQNRGFCTLLFPILTLTLQKRLPKVLACISELESFQLISKNCSYKEKEIKEKKRKEKNTPTILSESSALHHPLFLIWNSNCGTLPKAEQLSPKRIKSCRARWKDNPSEDYWTKAVVEITESSFCCGENERGWRANFDWFLKPDTHISVLEGKYRGKADEKKKVLDKLLKNKELTNGLENKYFRRNESGENEAQEGFLEDGVQTLRNI